MKTRLPAQAGAFYADNEGELRTQIHHCFLHKLGPGTVPAVPSEKDQTLVGLIVPHAGYMYSGPVAAHSYYKLAMAGPRTSIVILGPNHTGLGSGVSTMTSGEWSTPLGEVKVNAELANRVVRNSGLVDVEDEAHKYEHSIEVQLPFLQFIYPRPFQFVPICMMLQDLKTSIEVGEAVARAVENTDDIIIASSDWTHYESHQEAVAKDMEAIHSALSMDEKKFQDTIEEKKVSACGYGPVTAMIRASKILGAKSAQLLSYKTSGDVTGDRKAVVGYAAATFAR